MSRALEINEHLGEIEDAITSLLREEPDLIIEGGTNNQPMLKNLISQKTSVRYVGLDVNWEIVESGRFTRYGNCARPESVTPIAQEYNAQKIALVSWFALAGILSGRINHEERKDREDILTVQQTVDNITALYALQMHVLPSDLFNQTTHFYETSQDAGWKLHSYEDKTIMLLTR